MPPRHEPPAPEPAAPARRRRGGKGLLAAVAVLGLLGVFALPAFASEAQAVNPTTGIGDGDVQQLQVGSDLSAQGLSTDAISGSTSHGGSSTGGGTSGGDGVSGAGWMAPLPNASLGDPFGPRPEQPVAGVSLFHRGQDLIDSCGTPIRAAHAGTVTSATWWGTYGNWILVDDGSGVATGYAHESRILVTVGQHVREGQVIGLVGETGAATGCHLHLEIHLSGVAVNPVPFFAARGIRLG